MRTLAALAVCLLLFDATGSSAGIDVLDDLTKEATLLSGDKTEGTILIRNLSDKPAVVKVYQADYLFRADGSNTYGDPGSLPRSNSSWVSFKPHQFVIGPKDVGSAYYTVQVPKDDRLSGTYWSLLMIEPVTDDALDAPAAEPGKVKVGIKTIMRYAVQIVTNIGGGGVRQIRFTDKQLTAKDGKLSLLLDVENTGERWLRPSVRAEVYDADGAYLGSFGRSRIRVYPGCSVRQSIELGSMRPGKYNALVIVDNGDESVWGAQYALEIK